MFLLQFVVVAESCRFRDFCASRLAARLGDSAGPDSRFSGQVVRDGSSSQRIPSPSVGRQQISEKVLSLRRFPRVSGRAGPAIKGSGQRQRPSLLENRSNAERLLSVGDHRYGCMGQTDPVHVCREAPGRPLSAVRARRDRDQRHLRRGRCLLRRGGNMVGAAPGANLDFQARLELPGGPGPAAERCDGTGPAPTRTGTAAVQPPGPALLRHGHPDRHSYPERRYYGTATETGAVTARPLASCWAQCTGPAPTGLAPTSTSQIPAATGGSGRIS